MNNIGMHLLLISLIKSINKKRRYQLFVVFLLTIITSISEIIGIGSIVPFLGVLTQPELVLKNEYISQIVSRVYPYPFASLLVLFSVIFGIIAIITSVFRLLLLRTSIQLSNAIGVDIGSKIYEQRLCLPYEYHINENTSEVISSVTQKILTVTSAINAIVTIATSFLLLISIVAILLYINTIAAIVSFAVFGFGYFYVVLKSKFKLSVNSQIISSEQTRVIKVIQEGLGSIREVILGNNHIFYAKAYERSYKALQNALGNNLYLTLAPRYLMEGLALVLVAGLAIFYGNKVGGVGEYFPIIGALGLGAQRLLPLLQQIYGNWAVVTGSYNSLLEVCAQLNIKTFNSPLTCNQDIKFFNKICLKNICFRYKSGKIVLNNINFEIKKGDKIGIIGTTGSGKSTLVDIIMGLLTPTEGALYVDNNKINEDNAQSLRNIISHVPQHVYLIDGTIEANIAFGLQLDAVDKSRLLEAALMANLTEVIDKKHDKFQTVIGERGVKLSGGECQRIGIARALYRDAKILILDEATSALDEGTEASIMKTLDNLSCDLTILIIAHRVSSLKSCNKIIKINNGFLEKIGSYSEVINNA